MKHLLPILTAAFALTAATASAVDYYTDYFKSISYYNDTDYNVAPEELKKSTGPNEWDFIKYEQQTIDYGSYQVIRSTPDWNSFSGGNINDHYKIRITGESVDLYLADWMDTATGVDQKDALTNKNIIQYGYHFVDDKTHVDSNGVAYDREIWTMQEAIEDPERYGVLERYKTNDGDTLRHGYYLGNFTTGDEIEIYMKDGSGEIYSNHYNYNGGRFFSPNYDQVVAAQLGYLTEPTDAQKEEARKAMPLAELEPTIGHTVLFGIYAGPAPEVAFRDDPDNGEGGGGGGNGTSGHPLPGGLPIALVSGLFALGFWYFRRRKAIVG